MRVFIGINASVLAGVFFACWHDSRVIELRPQKEAGVRARVLKDNARAKAPFLFSLSRTAQYTKLWTPMELYLLSFSTLASSFSFSLQIPLFLSSRGTKLWDEPLIKRRLEREAEKTVDEPPYLDVRKRPCQAERPSTQGDVSWMDTA